MASVESRLKRILKESKKSSPPSILIVDLDEGLYTFTHNGKDYAMTKDDFNNFTSKFTDELVIICDYM